MAELYSLKVATRGDIISQLKNRANITDTTVSEISHEDVQLLQQLLNEHYIAIATERDWHFRTFDRAFKMPPADSTGTATVTENSREVTLSGRAVTAADRGKSIKFTNVDNLYRIIGVNAAASKIYLEARYTGSSSTTQTYSIYQYEFALPPDCDDVLQAFVYNSSTESPELEIIDNLEFNRILSTSAQVGGEPFCCTRSSYIEANSGLEVLDEMILDYDFLGGKDQDKSSRLRIFPIAPSAARIININYSIQVNPLTSDTDRLVFPVDDNWVLMNFVLSDFFLLRHNDVTRSTRLRSLADKRLKEMRRENRLTDTKPRFIPDTRSYRREHIARNSNRDIFELSRRNRG